MFCTTYSRGEQLVVSACQKDNLIAGELAISPLRERIDWPARTAMLEHGVDGRLYQTPIHSIDQVLPLELECGRWWH
jgi:hypothetical protein